MMHIKSKELYSINLYAISEYDAEDDEKNTETYFSLFSCDLQLRSLI
jgi:hypothetical protein